MTNGTAPVQSHHQALAALCLCIPAAWLQLTPSVKLVVNLFQVVKVQAIVLLISAHFATECTLCRCALLAMQTSILNARHRWHFTPAADAAKKDPEQFKIWRENPAKFSFDGRYPLLEVYDKAKEAWKGMTDLCLLCLSASMPASQPACLPACLPVCLSACLSVCLYVCLSVCLPFCLRVCLLLSQGVRMCAGLNHSFLMHISVGLQA